jgi:hypothetical protein
MPKLVFLKTTQPGLHALEGGYQCAGCICSVMNSQASSPQGQGLRSHQLVAFNFDQRHGSVALSYAKDQDGLTYQ